MSRKAALIEIGGSHDECLYSQLLFLKHGGYNTTLMCSESLRSQVSEFQLADNTVFYDYTNKSAWQKLKLALSIRNHIIGNGIDTVIFNTAQSSQARDIVILPYPKRVKFYGTLHSLEKLRGSFTQKLISSKVRNYYLLNDYLLDKVNTSQHVSLRFQSYYPIFFPPIKASLPEKKNLWIAIPGQVEYKRRDYETLVKAFASLSPRPDITFVLAGKSEHQHGNGKELKQLLQKLGVAAHFIMWDGFVRNDVFHAYMQQCDIVMPLIHPGNEGYEQYLNDQISGAYNLAFAYKKPLLMLSDFEQYEDFNENALFYTLPTLADTLGTLQVEINIAANTLYSNPKWLFEAQATRYLDFLK